MIFSRPVKGHSKIKRTIDNRPYRISQAPHRVAVIFHEGFAYLNLMTLEPYPVAFHCYNDAYYNNITIRVFRGEEAEELN